ncbi:MAG: hypothetical protein ACM359_04670 [Bacillota bacterium]
MNYRHRLIGCSVLLALLLVARHLPAAIPGADNPKVFTFHDFLKAILDFNRRTLIEPYKAIGSRNEKWDSATLDFLDKMTVRFTYNKADPLYWPANYPTREETMALGKASLDAGCDDPLVLYCYSSLLDDGNQVEQALPLLKRATTGLIKSKYPKYRVASACNRVVNRLDPQKEQAERTRFWNEQWMAGLACMGGDFLNQDRRIIWENVRPNLIGSSDQHHRYLYEAVQKMENADPWLVQMIGGNYHITAAWSARGKGLASTVTDEGWRRFHEHLAEARKCLRKAHELQPTYPEAACRMIAVAMGDGDTLGENPRDWFDKAVAAEFDYIPAYNAMFWALRPRWGGSHEQMYRLGLECLQTGRFDTMVPYQLLRALNDINEERGYDYACFAQPGVFENVADLLTRYAEADKSPANAHRSSLVALAFRLGKFEEAKKVLDDLGGNATHREFEGVTALVEPALSKIYAMGGPNAAQLKAAEQLASKGQYQEACGKYQAVAASLAKDSKESLYVRGRCAELRWRMDLSKGEWVSILPTAGLDGWYMAEGQWRIDEHAGCVGNSDGTDMTLACLMDVGQRFEVQLAIDSAGDAKSQPYVGALVGYSGPGSYYGVLIDRANGKLLINPSRGQLEEYDIPSGAGHVLHIRVFDRQMSIAVNGKEVVRDYKIDIRPYGRGSHLCIGASATEPKPTVRISGIKVRLLTQ